MIWWHKFGKASCNTERHAYYPSIRVKYLYTHPSLPFFHLAHNVSHCLCILADKQVSREVHKLKLAQGTASTKTRSSSLPQQSLQIAITGSPGALYPRCPCCTCQSCTRTPSVSSGLYAPQSPTPPGRLFVPTPPSWSVTQEG